MQPLFLLCCTTAMATYGMEVLRQVLQKVFRVLVLESKQKHMTSKLPENLGTPHYSSWLVMYGTRDMLQERSEGSLHVTLFPLLLRSQSRKPLKIILIMIHNIHVTLLEGLSMYLQGSTLDIIEGVIP